MLLVRNGPLSEVALSTIGYNAAIEGSTRVYRTLAPCLQYCSNVLGKRAGQASELVKILYILYSTTYYTNNIEDIEIKQIILLFIYFNSMFI
jgi:hypothetical protein